MVLGSHPRELPVSFNPLRFGAGALPETPSADRFLGLGVSIPFVSGREHSPVYVGFARVRSICRFNPLRFGAGALPTYLYPALQEANPFQSPSFRGGSTPVRIQPRHGWPSSTATSFNPLRFGAGALPLCNLYLRRYSDWRSFNPLRFGAGALPFEREQQQQREFQCFNPLRFGAGALPWNGNCDRRAVLCFNPLRFGAGALPSRSA